MKSYFVNGPLFYHIALSPLGKTAICVPERSEEGRAQSPVARRSAQSTLANPENRLPARRMRAGRSAASKNSPHERPLTGQRRCQAQLLPAASKRSEDIPGVHLAHKKGRTRNRHGLAIGAYPLFYLHHNGSGRNRIALIDENTFHRTCNRGREVVLHLHSFEHYDILSCRNRIARGH